jgi:hypothetical protein
MVTETPLVIHLMYKLFPYKIDSQNINVYGFRAPHPFTDTETLVYMCSDTRIELELLVSIKFCLL